MAGGGGGRPAPCCRCARALSTISWRCAGVALRQRSRSIWLPRRRQLLEAVEVLPHVARSFGGRDWNCCQRLRSAWRCSGGRVRQRVKRSWAWVRCSGDMPSQRSLPRASACWRSGGRLFHCAAERGQQLLLLRRRGSTRSTGAAGAAAAGGAGAGGLLRKQREPRAAAGSRRRLSGACYSLFFAPGGSAAAGRRRRRGLRRRAAARRVALACAR